MDDLPSYDYTGYGPAGAGNSPTPGERRKTATDKFHSGRAIDSMRYLDPTIVSANEAIAKARQRANPNATPDEIRRTMYNTKGGQAAQDAAFAARNSGYAGYGSPVDFAAQNMQGIAAGGFSMDTLTGNSDGTYNTVGPGQRVTGNGSLAEGVAVNYNKGIIKDLYGNGDADPGKTSGFYMDEMAGVIQKITSRGGIGTAATLIKDASFEDRFSSQLDNAVDGTIVDGMKKQDIKLLRDLDEKGKSKDEHVSKEGMRQQEEYLKTLTDPKVRAETAAFFKSTDAVVYNDATRKKVTDLGKEIAKGMASLSDIYDELSAPALHAKLESIAGKKIVNATQAKQANNMVNQLTNAATANGMDPRAFMESTAMFQYQNAGRFAAAFGMGASDTTRANAIAGNLSPEIMTRSAFEAKQSLDRITQGAELGIDLTGTDMNMQDLAEDKTQGVENFAKRYDSFVVAKGMRDSMTGDDQKRLDAAFAEFSAAKTPTEKLIANSKIGGIIAPDGNVQKFLDGTAATAYRQRATEGPGRDALLNEIDKGRTAAINNTGIVSFARQSETGGGLGLSADDAKKFADLATTKVSGSGMLDLATTGAKIKDTDDRKRAQLDILKKAGLSDEDSAFFLDTITDDKGVMLQATKGVTQQTVASGRGGTTYEKAKAADARMAELSSQRKKFKNEDGAITVRSISRALLSNSSTDINTPEARAMAIEAMIEEDGDVGYDGVKFADETVSGLDVSQGFTKESLKDINELAGGDSKVAKAMGFESEDAFIKASKTDSELRLRSIDFLSSQEGFTLSGPQNNLSGISKKGEDAFNKSDFNKRAGMLKAARLLVPQLAETDKTTLSDSIAQGKNPDLKGLFEASSYDSSWFGLFDGDRTEMKNADRLVDLAGTINSADADEMKGIQNLDTNGDLLKNLTAQRAAINDAINDDIKTIDTRDSKTGKATTVDANAQTLKMLDEAIKKLGGATTQATMRVTNLHVENYND